MENDLRAGAPGETQKRKVEQTRLPSRTEKTSTFISRAEPLRHSRSTANLTGSFNLQEKFGEDTLWWDLGTSPVLAGGNLVIAVMQEGESYIVAINLEDGSVNWKADRTFPVQKESGQSYTTPIVTEIDGQETIVIWGADRLSGHHPKNGKLIWKCEGFNPEDNPMWRVIASPGVTNGIAVIPYGRTKFCAGVKLGGSGDITSTRRLWERNDLGADCPTPVGRDGKNDRPLRQRTIENYLDAETGKDFWQDAIPRARAKYYSSPILAGDLLYCAREDGVVTVIKVNDNGMEIVAQNDMGGKNRCDTRVFRRPDFTSWSRTSLLHRE